MKYLRLLFGCFLILSVDSFVIAQEFTYQLNENPGLNDRKGTASQFQGLSSIDDTISLPFEDDFSRPGTEPFDSLWLDSSGVFINNNYSELPVTIGIATFDGLNLNGKPYNPSAADDSVADVLTSRPIDLTVPPGDTSVWLSFFYQPQGLGDAPETPDSLILQFKDTGNVWHTIWSVPGREDTVFQRVNIRITDEIYLFRGFQLRFYNIATVNGNRDHWNLDYLTLKKNTFGNAPILDNALVRPQISLLSEFTAMPYSHYKALGLSAMKSSIEDTIYNIDYGQTSYIPAADILQSGAQIFTGSTFASTAVPNAYIPFTIPLNNFSYPIQNTDSADFVVKPYFSQAGIETNSFNDTSYCYQHFYNYYAYDDGSVNVPYAITGNSDLAMAYKFDIKVTDTLRGVQIYFDARGEDVSNKLFQLTAWSDVNVSSNTAVELYRVINQKPDSFLGRNIFRTYLFDSTLIVGPGNIWVGFVQNEPDVLYGIGRDRNTDSHSKMFCRIDGLWFNSLIPGSWMMRPLFGKRIPLVSVEEYQRQVTTFSIFPNPATNTIHLQFENSNRKNYRYQIFNCLGAIVKEENIPSNMDIDISNISKGFYIVRLLNKSDNYVTAAQKLIVR